MKARPILFSGEMVRALLDGRKSQTRRVFKVAGPMGDQHAITSPDEEIQKWDDGSFHYLSTGALSGPYPCPYGQPGDMLWVRETGCFAKGRSFIHGGGTANFRQFRVDCAGGRPFTGRWQPSIYMPRWASRLTLHLTDVGVERVQEISEPDADDEGMELRHGYWMGAPHPGKGTHKCMPTAREAFQTVWDYLNAKRGYGWELNPWVWVLEFRTIHANVDDVERDPTAYGLEEAA